MFYLVDQKKLSTTVYINCHCFNLPSLLFVTNEYLLFGFVSNTIIKTFCAHHKNVILQSIININNNYK